MNASDRIDSLERQLREHGTQAFPLVSTRQRIVREQALTQDDAELLLAWVAYWEEKASTSTADLVRTDRALQETRELVVSQQREILKLRGDVSEALIESGRAKADLAARVAEQDAEALRYYAADGSFVVMESREAVVAARIEAAKRVAELEAERDAFRAGEGMAERVALDLRDEADKWRITANALRDALEHYAKVDACEVEEPCLHSKCEFPACVASYRRAKVAVAALASTPAASLAAHDAEVLERAIAEITNRCVRQVGESSLIPGYNRCMDDVDRAIERIRALAAQAQEVKP